jgi:UDP-N-acetylmuramate: L-alanyl-gamma-D-glutamyl-meso-diaminopimelate ligase
MHVHILGIGGTFMGGVAAIAKAAGFRVTGSDLNVYPPMSTQLRRSASNSSGLRRRAARPEPDIVVVGNALSRGSPVVEAMLDRGMPTPRGRSGWPSRCCATARARRGRHARQDHHQQHAGLDPRDAG